MKVSELSQYLKERGVVIAGLRKPELVDLCEKARELQLEFDPDGLIEDRAEVINSKLRDGDVLLPNPALIDSGSPDISTVPEFSVFDIMTYLLTNLSHGAIRDYKKSEAFTMMLDGFVREIDVVCLKHGYFGVRGKVKPRTRQNDPVTGASHYQPWCIITSQNTDNRSCILSGFCTCKGGIDGCCRHLQAMLYEILDFRDDSQKSSVTSGPCLWVRRATGGEEASLLTEISTSMAVSSTIQLKPTEDTYKPVAEEDLPPIASLLKDIKRHLPEAVVLQTLGKRADQPMFAAPDLCVRTLQDKIKFSKCSSAEDVLADMKWTACDVREVEEKTRGQNINSNWHAMRKGLITASNVKRILHSTNPEKTAAALEKGNNFPDGKEPEALLYGRNHELKALELFFKGHRYRHRKCTYRQPGLYLSQSHPFLGASPDAIGLCEHKNCGSFLVEVKCLYSHRSYHPRTAMKLRGLCTQDENKVFHLQESHSYYMQMQCQMAVSGIHKAYLCVYTNKGIETIKVPFNPDFWSSALPILQKFWSSHVFPKLKVL